MCALRNQRADAGAGAGSLYAQAQDNGKPRPLAYRDCAQALKHLADKGAASGGAATFPQQNNTAQLAFDTVKEVLCVRGGGYSGGGGASGQQKPPLQHCPPCACSGNATDRKRERTASEGRMRPQKIRAVKQL